MVLDASVVATNVLLTGLFLFLFLLTSEIFNSTIDEHRAEVEGWFTRLVRGPLRFLAPLARADAAVDHLAESGRGGAILHTVAVLAVLGVVYGLLSADFGLNEQTLVLIVSLMVGLGLLTYLNFGGKSLIVRRRYRTRSVVRLYGTAVIVAAACVLVSRFVDFHPGFVYGFVASMVILAPVALTKRDEARIVALPAMALLVVSLAAWLLLGPVRAAAAEGGSLGSTLLESILGVVFLGGLEGLLFSLLPIRYLDGAKILAWSRPAWVLLYGVVVFLWWQLLLNRDAAYVDALKQPSVQAVFGVLLVWGITTGCMWTYFRIRDRGRSEEEVEEAEEEAEEEQDEPTEAVTDPDDLDGIEHPEPPEAD